MVNKYSDSASATVWQHIFFSTGLRWSLQSALRTTSFLCLSLGGRQQYTEYSVSRSKGRNSVVRGPLHKDTFTIMRLCVSGS